MEQAFLQEILRDPDNDLPRLIYADWLEEQGDPRAEFIRVQCELVQDGISRQRNLDLRRRERELLAEYHDSWLPPVSDKLRKVRFHRGFLEEATLGLRTLINHGETIYRQTPLHRVTLTGGRNRIPDLCQCESLRHIRQLAFERNDFAQDAVGQFGSCPRLGNLELLDLSTASIGPSGLSQLCTPGTFPRLKSLRLTQRRFLESLEPLFTGTPFPALESLTVTGIGGTATLFPLLARSPQYAGLKYLATGSYGNQGQDLTPLCECDHLRNLEEFRVQGYDLQLKASLPRFFASNRYPALRRIILTYTNVSGTELAALANSPLLGQLEFLDLSYTPIQNRADIEQLVESPHWNGQTKLNLINCRLPDSHRAALQERYGKTFGRLNRWADYNRIPG